MGMIDIKDCEIINQRILPTWAKSVIMFTIPYRSEAQPQNKDGFSEYARIYDYHRYSNELYQRISTAINTCSEKQFKGFCDHSPINEKIAAAKCGLGVIGRNSLLIDDVYGSFVFLGSIITDEACSYKANEVKYCDNCGLCKTSCPNSAITDKGIEKGLCLSAISQKKNKTSIERELLKNHNIVWGCDICQNVCPHNAKAKISPIPYFKQTRIQHIDHDYIINLSDEDFEKFAFSFKGRKNILNNIDFI